VTSDAVGAAEVREFWDAQAACFDAEPDHGCTDPETRAAWRALLAEALPAPPARVADLGCGTGTLSVLLAEEGHTVTGLDLAPAMVADARAKAARHVVGASFGVGDVADPNLPVGAYDVVLSRHVVWALPDPEAALRRWLRLLRPGGRLVLVEGRWWTGGGLSLAELTAVLTPLAGIVTHRLLPDPALWGRALTDERYLVVARP
jgi:SAM-dependent methyltransferase